MLKPGRKTSEAIFHAVFWIAFLMVSITLTIEVFGWDRIFLRVSTNALTFLTLVYLNFYLLLPRFFMRGKYSLYLLSVVGAVASMTIVRAELDDYFVSGRNLLPVEIHSIGHYTAVAITYFLILIATSSFRLIKDSYEKLKLEQEMKNYKLEAELKFLKAQVNPHFLFNSLNNIYSLNQSRPEQASEMILKLSDMMRYMIYESNEKKVPLQKEIDYLNNYIALQQMRTREKQNIRFEIEGDPANVKIEPMFFVPLLENSYKHGNITDTKNGWILCKLIIKNSEIEFTVTNSTAQEQRKDKLGGVGLENIKKRLQLLYPLCHVLSACKEKNTFTSSVKIQLS
jgi:two-component system, LytTR family, sensor kinase